MEAVHEQPVSRRMKAGRQAVLTVAATTLLALLCAEVLARLVFHPHDVVVRIEKSREGPSQFLRANSAWIESRDPILPYVYRTSALYPDVTQPPISSLGLRDYDRYTPLPPEHTHRTLVIGDSVAAGFAVPLEDTLAKQLERSLASEAPSEGSTPGRVRLHHEVLNGGVDGYNLREVVRWLRVIGLSLSPDLVIYAYSLNDRSDPPGYLRDYEFHRDGSSRVYWQENLPYVWSFGERWDRLLLEGSRLYALFQRVLTRLEIDCGKEENIHLLVPESRGHVALFRELAAMCRGEGVRLLVVIFPEYRQLDPYPREDEHRWVREVCLDLGISCIDLLEPSRKWPLVELRGRHPVTGEPDPIHPSKLGYRVAVEEILRVWPDLTR